MEMETICVPVSVCVCVCALTREPTCLRELAFDSGIGAAVVVRGCEIKMLSFCLGFPPIVSYSSNNHPVLHLHEGTYHNHNRIISCHWF